MSSVDKTENSRDRKNRQAIPARQHFGTMTALALAIGMAGCRTFVPKIDVERAQALPAAYRTASGNAGVATPDAWWNAFEDAEMERMVQQALAGNLTLAQAEARLRQARAAAAKAGAARYPDVSATANAETNRREGNGDSDAFEQYGLGMAARYELDLWGRVRALTESARADAMASSLDFETAGITVAAQAADLWLHLVEARQQAVLLRAQADTARRMLALLEKRMGKTSRLLDVYQQEQAALALEAAFPRADLTVALLENQLAALLGLPAGSVPDVQATALPSLPPLPDTGIPAALLTRRPDVQARYLRLKAAGWNVASARADRLPALTLTARANAEGSEFAGLFDNWLLNIAAGLTAPVLDGGRRRAEANRSVAVLDEAWLRYREAVLEAAREVEDALTGERLLNERVAALQRTLDIARKTLGESERRYLGGASDYVSVLLALRGVQQSERDLLAARRERLSNRIGLYRALGGSWKRRKEGVSGEATEEANSATPESERHGHRPVREGKENHE